MRTIADGLFRARVNFHNHAIRPYRNGRLGDRRHQTALAHRVTGVDDHRQVREFVQHRDRRDIAGIARSGFKGSDAAFAEHHLRVAVRHNVLSRHQQFLNRGAQPALQHHRAAAAAQCFQHGEVLHVARAHLHDVCVFSHQFHIAVAHHFGHNRQTGSFPCLRQQLQPLAFHALEIVRRSARFKSPAAQNGGPGRSYSFRRLHNLLFAFHRAGAGHGDELIPANFSPAHLDDRPFFAELFAHELVRRGYAHGFLHSRGGFKALQAGSDIAARAYYADHNSFLAFNGMNAEPKITNPFTNMVNFLLRGIWPHRDNH